MTPRPLRAAIYARVGPADQTADYQPIELRRYVEARGWVRIEFVDTGVSGPKDRRPALDALLKDTKRRARVRDDLLAVAAQDVEVDDGLSPPEPSTHGW